MAEELSLKLKIAKTLYGMGFKGQGETLLTELKKGGPEWQNFVNELLSGDDYPRRKLALKQLTGRNVIARSKYKDQLIAMLLEFLTSKGATGEEKKVALKYVDKNIEVFPIDDDVFKGKIMALQRETDPQLSSLAAALLPKIGVDLDDREMFRRH